MKKLLLSVMFAACAVTPPQGEISSEVGAVACDYTQAFGNGSHAGIPCPEVQGMHVAAVLPQDRDSDAENDASGFLQVHESAPLTSGDFVIVPGKEGFVSRQDRSPERWTVDAYRWVPGVSAPGAALVPVWSTKTGWQPVDSIIGPGFTNGYVMGFFPLIANGSVYAPDRFGRVARINLATGALVTRIDPFAGTSFSGDARVIGVNGLSSDRAGNVYYAVTAFNATSNSNSVQPRASWLVRVTPSNVATAVPWTQIASASVGVPQGTDICEYPFGTAGTPLATGPGSQAPRFGCGDQRPGFNATIAIDEVHGTLVALSYSNNATGTVFLVEIDATTLTPIRAMDTRGRMLHGCGQRLSLTSNSCKTITANGTTHLGFDPAFNAPVKFRGLDIMDGAPIVAPDGSKTISGYDGGFGFGGAFDGRGASVTFDASGAFKAANLEFGWEVTPTVWEHGGSYSYLQDRNLYSALQLDTGRYSPTQALETIGTIPLTFDPVAIDWLDAHMLFGPGGDYYAVNGDGHAYKFDASGKQIDAAELPNPDGSIRSMETLSGYGARDRAGRLYLSYAGYVYVIDGTGGPGRTITPLPPGPALAAGIAAKHAAAGAVPAVQPQ